MLKLSLIFSHEVCSQTTTTEDSRLDIKANGVSDSPFSRTFSMFKFATHSLKRVQKYKQRTQIWEAQKKLEYESPLWRNARFNHIVFASTSGAGPPATKVMIWLAAKINEKGSKAAACWAIRERIFSNFGFPLSKTQSTSDKTSKFGYSTIIPNLHFLLNKIAPSGAQYYFCFNLYFFWNKKNH